MQAQIRPKHTFKEESDTGGIQYIAKDQTMLNRSYVGTSIAKLKRGAHVGWERLYNLVHHGIVSSVNPNGSEFTVIHFSKDKKDKKIKIHEEVIHNTQENTRYMFQFHYPQSVINKNPPDVVIRRAKDGTGSEQKYEFFRNNCEHFATYCKTGERFCCQTTWAKERVIGAVAISGAGGLKTGATGVVTSVLKKTVETGGRVVSKGSKASTSAITCTLKETAENGARVIFKGSKAPRPALIKEATSDAGRIMGGSTKITKYLNRVATGVGIGITVVTEICSTGKDIYTYSKQKEKGEISNDDFKHMVTKRVSESVIGGLATIGGDLAGMKAGALTGAFVGSFVGPVGTAIGAVAGSIIGSLVGSLLARTAGKFCGGMFGQFLGGNLFLK